MWRELDIKEVGRLGRKRCPNLHYLDEKKNCNLIFVKILGHPPASVTWIVRLKALYLNLYSIKKNIDELFFSEFVNHVY